MNDPGYYVFLYRGEQIRNGRVLPFKQSGWKYPKQYRGPYETHTEARTAVATELEPRSNDDIVLTPKEKRSLRRQYRIRRLTPLQFKKIWGSLPGQDHAGW